MSEYPERKIELEGMEFTELLKEWRDKLEEGPDESDGYTDKYWHADISMIEQEINFRLPRKQE